MQSAKVSSSNHHPPQTCPLIKNSKGNKPTASKQAA